ncbi:hypothetical protein AB1Y20_017654 [Prymnesium parvum]|uniref:Uncharacterized protein n=1 Tax=Prymnesium parvum TaxID=97485 RepID=A0AB34JQ30_PRYPA
MSANATLSNVAVEAPNNTNTGRIDHIHISHGGEQAPATSAAVVGASPNVGKGQEPQKTPQRAPQANWLEGLVRSIQGRGAGAGQDGGPSGQPPPPPYPPSDEEEEEDTAVAARLTQPRRVSLIARISRGGGIPRRGRGALLNI